MAAVPLDKLEIGKEYLMPPRDKFKRPEDYPGPGWRRNTRMWDQMLAYQEGRIHHAGQPFRVTSITNGQVHTNIPITINEKAFIPGTTFKLTPSEVARVARDVRNARLVSERSNLPHGVEALIAENLSGLSKKNAAQQNDELRHLAGISGPAPNRKGYSGGKTRRRRHRKMTYRQRRR
jgi:hypothetical protein